MDVKIEYIEPGVSGSENGEINYHTDKMNKSRATKFPKDVEIEVERRYAFCTCKTNSERHKHHTKETDGICDFCEHHVYWSPWKSDFISLKEAEYNGNLKGKRFKNKKTKKRVKPKTDKPRIYSKEDKEKFLVLCGEMRYNVTEISKKLNLPRGTVRWRIKNWS